MLSAHQACGPPPDDKGVYCLLCSLVQHPPPALQGTPAAKSTSFSVLVWLMPLPLPEALALFLLPLPSLLTLSLFGPHISLWWTLRLQTLFSWLPYAPYLLEMSAAAAALTEVCSGLWGTATQRLCPSTGGAVTAKD